ncbi:MAG: hypothetical protein PWR30_507, partial [Candidatus Woesearchaeota archaeon]|nr:hypothetical protein [Candidatus Woesearchaeota archaeon]
MNMNKGFVLFGSLFIVFSLFLSSGYSQENPEEIINFVVEGLSYTEVDPSDPLKGPNVDLDYYYEKYSKSLGCEEDCIDKFYEEVMDRNYEFGKEGELILTSWAASNEKDAEKSSEYKKKEFELYVEIGDSIKEDEERLKWYEEGIKRFEIDYDNLDESVSSMEILLSKAYDSYGKDNPEEFYNSLSEDSELTEDDRAILDLWMSRQTELDYEKRIEYGQEAANYFSDKASSLEEKDFIEKSNLYQLAADSLVKPPEDVKEGYTIEDYEEERNSYLVDSYYYLSQYYSDPLLESNAESYYAKMDLYEKLESLPEGAEGKESGMSVEEVKEEITRSLSSGEQFSWMMRDTVDAINLGKSISEKMYENFAFYKTIEDSFDDLVSPIYEFFGGTGFGKFLTGNFENLICANLLKVHGETPVLATEDGRLGSYVAGKRQTINNPDGSVKYLYKITFKIDPAFDSNNKETNLSMQVYDNNGEPYYLDLDGDRDAEDPGDPYILEKF